MAVQPAQLSRKAMLMAVQPIQQVKRDKFMFKGSLGSKLPSYSKLTMGNFNVTMLQII